MATVRYLPSGSTQFLDPEDLRTAVDAFTAACEASPLRGRRRHLTPAAESAVTASAAAPNKEAARGCSPVDTRRGGMLSHRNAQCG